MDARKALAKVVDILTNNDGYYAWTAMGEPPAWFLRVPREDKGDGNWEKRESADMVHMCSPVKFVEAMERNDRKDISNLSGYVVDSKCVRCKRDIPEDVEKRLEIQIKLTSLRKKAAE